MGCMKKVSLEKLVLGLDGRSLKKQKDEIEVEIKPGYSNGDQLRFKEKGNEGYEYKNCNSHSNRIADLVITIKELEHERYKRKGNDLVYKHKILLINAICANTFEMETIDHRIIMISLDEIVTPSSKKLIEGEGMPICRTTEKEIIADYKGKPKIKGNLWITFDIIFPTQLNPKHKELLKDLLSQ
jgi:DnaJ-class molecular chaperone